MDPRTLFPFIALVFTVAALVRRSRSRNWAGAPKIWLLIALIFAAVSVWLQMAQRD